ncbi:hypothetical protein Nepgr_008120 [Nepenthes gracilis]|uniref:Uncharacterized protein n=1 Tax=Nepenthes gracilis TaxID=150966 RepID=A0AAD3S8B9_NEPGR|nr:hypothetical protein Nepgr_008120 [Nepenthes gracilis]
MLSTQSDVVSHGREDGVTYQGSNHFPGLTNDDFAMRLRAVAVTASALLLLRCDLFPKHVLSTMPPDAILLTPSIQGYYRQLNEKLPEPTRLVCSSSRSSLSLSSSVL